MPKPRFADGSTQTGRWRWRRRFLFPPVLEVEVERKVWAPRFTGHTPTNWRTVTEWKRGEAYHDFPEGGRVG